MGNLIMFPPQIFTRTTIDTDAAPGLFSPIIAKALQNKVCRSVPMTVMTAGSDLGAILRKQEEQLRAGNLTVVFAGTVDATGWGQNVPWTPERYPDFLSAFQARGFDPGNLDDAGAIMTHDALLTATQAVRLAATGGSPALLRIPTTGDVRRQLLNLNGLQAVPGASGTLSFSFSQTGAGNPRGKLVPVFQFPRPLGVLSPQVVGLPTYVTP